MEASLGKQLRDARLRKNIPVEEAARLTKIHRDRITDLENDTYSNFPSLAYARSFLVLYAKFLGVDISSYPTLDVGNPAGVGAYQYLQTEPQTPKVRHSSRPLPQAKPRWVSVAVVGLVALALGVFCAMMLLNLARLPSHTPPGKQPPPAVVTPSPAAIPLPTATPVMPPPPPATPVPQAAATPEPSPVASLALAEGSATPTGFFNATPPPATTFRITPVESVPTPQPLLDGTVAAPLDAGTPVPVAKAIPIKSSYTEGPIRRIKLEVTRKTHVKIIRDISGSPAIFEGWLNPGKATRYFPGRHFWIQTPDREAVKATLELGPGRMTEVTSSTVSGDVDFAD